MAKDHPNLLWVNNTGAKSAFDLIDFGDYTHALTK